jgi:YD repeat-containing protein
MAGRCVTLGLLVGLWLADGGCGVDSRAPYPPIPPPPAEATSSCRYERLSSTSELPIATSTLWLNQLGQTIRADSYLIDPDNNVFPAATEFRYDAQGRLVESRNPIFGQTVEYDATRVTVSSTPGGSVIYQLVDGRVVRIENAQGQSTMDYAYDDAGRITSTTISDGTRPPYVYEYAYDAQGRVVHVHTTREFAPEPTSSLVYRATASSLSIEVDYGSGASRLLAYGFDDRGRIVRAVRAADDPGTPDLVATYRYLDGEIDSTQNSIQTDRGVVIGAGTSTVRATGTCAPPPLIVAPPLPLPLLPTDNGPRLYILSLLDAKVF